ncbi:MAG: hypothetical protein AB1497_08825 [Bacillota bacterium]
MTCLDDEARDLGFRVIYVRNPKLVARRVFGRILLVNHTLYDCPPEVAAALVGIYEDPAGAGRHLPVIQAYWNARGLPLDARLLGIMWGKTGYYSMCDRVANPEEQ